MAEFNPNQTQTTQIEVKAGSLWAKVTSRSLTEILALIGVGVGIVVGGWVWDTRDELRAMHVTIKAGNAEQATRLQRIFCLQRFASDPKAGENCEAIAR